MNKLDYLAQKEEELRKLNDQLDQRKNNLLQQPVPKTTSDPLADSLDMRKTGTHGGENPFDDNKVMRQSSTSLMNEAKQVRETYARESDEGLDRQDMDEEEVKGDSDMAKRYQMLVDKIKDQDKTINFQKAKIVALQAELEDTIKSTGNVDSKVEDLEKANKNLAEENKKLNEKLNAQNLSQQKMKTQN